ncbi:MAG: hypothetical protein MRERC_20c001, partial [Mycoplasmataceae bacterium RC_NB112A]
TITGRMVANQSPISYQSGILLITDWFNKYSIGWPIDSRFPPKSVINRAGRLMVNWWSIDGRLMVDWWSINGQNMVKWSNYGQIKVKLRSN